MPGSPSRQHIDDLDATAQGIERVRRLFGWGAAQFKSLPQRMVADVWQEGSEVRNLWDQALEAL